MAGSDTDSDTDFVENFLINVLSGNDFNPLLSNLHAYRINEEDVIGEIYHLSVNFLRGSSCPDRLVCPLSRLVRESIADEDLLTCRADRPTQNTSEPEYNIIKLQNLVRSKIFRVCQNLQGKPDFQTELRDNAQEGGDVVDSASGSLLTQLKNKSDYLSNVRFSGYAIKNRRPKMEDTHIIIPDLSALFGKDDCPCTTYCGIFDGHVGEEAAVYAATHLHRFIVEDEDYNDNLEEALRKAFVKTDDIFCKRLARFPFSKRSGTTGVVVLIRGKRMYMGWLGDSQATLYRNGYPVFTVESHKPNKESEQKRIEAAGGFVSFLGTWRVMGLLAVSRAIGDPDYKPYVTADPDIVAFDLDGNEDMVIMGSDGVWDTVSPQLALDMAAETLGKDDADGPTAVAREIVNGAKSYGSVDNITAVVIFLQDDAKILANCAAANKSNSESSSTDLNATLDVSRLNAVFRFPLPRMNDVSKESAWRHDPAELKSAFGAAEPGNNGFNHGTDSSGGSSPYPDGHGPADVHDGLTTNGSNGHHHHDASDDDQPPTPTMASGMTYGDLSPEHAGFYPEHSSVEPGFPNMVNLPGDLPEVTEEEEEERKQVEALVAGQGHSDQLVIDRVSPTSEDVHSAISAIDTALLPEQTGLASEVEETGDEPLSDDDWNYVKPGDAPQAVTAPMGGADEDQHDELHDHDIDEEDHFVREEQVQQQNLNPFLESVPAGTRTPDSEEEDDEMARYRLNPDANEFVPQMTGHAILAPAAVEQDGIDLLQHEQQEAENKGNPFEEQLIETGPASPQLEPAVEKCGFDFTSEAAGPFDQDVDYQAPPSSTPEFLQHLEQQQPQEPLIAADIMHQEDIDSPFSDSGAAQPVEPETAQIGEASEDEAPAQTMGSFDDDHVEQNSVEDSFERIDTPVENVPELAYRQEEEEVLGGKVEQDSREVQEQIVEQHGVVDQADVSGEIEVGAEQFTGEHELAHEAVEPELVAQHREFAEAEPEPEPAFEQQEFAPADPEVGFERRAATPVEAEPAFEQREFAPVEPEVTFEHRTETPVEAEPAYERHEAPVEPAVENQLVAPVYSEPTFERQEVDLVDCEPAFEPRGVSPVDCEPEEEEVAAGAGQQLAPVDIEPAFNQEEVPAVHSEPAFEQQPAVDSEPIVEQQQFAPVEAELAFEQHQAPVDAELVFERQEFSPVEPEPAFEQRQELAAFEAEPAFEQHQESAEAEPVLDKHQESGAFEVEPAFEQQQFIPVETEHQDLIASEPELVGIPAAQPEPAFEQHIESEPAVEHQEPLEVTSLVEAPQMPHQELEGAHEERFEQPSPIPEVHVEQQPAQDYPPQFMDDYQPEPAPEEKLDEVEAQHDEPKSSALLDFGGAGEPNAELLGYPQMMSPMRHVASEAFASNLLMPEENMSRSDEVEDLSTAPSGTKMHPEASEEQASPAPGEQSMGSNSFYSPLEQERSAMQQTVFYSPEEEQVKAEASSLDEFQTPPPVETAQMLETPVVASDTEASPVAPSVEEAVQEPAAEVPVAEAVAAGVAVAAVGTAAAVAAKKKTGIAGAKPGSAPRPGTTKPTAARPAPASAKVGATRAAPAARPAVGAAKAPAKAPARPSPVAKSPAKTTTAPVAKKPATTTTTTTAAKKPATTVGAAPKPAAARPASAATKPATTAPRVPAARPTTATRPAAGATAAARPGTSPAAGLKKPAGAPAARPAAAKTASPAARPSPSAAAPKPRASPSTTSTASPRSPAAAKPKPATTTSTRAPTTTRPAAPRPGAAKPPSAKSKATTAGTSKPQPIRRPGAAAQKPAAETKTDANSPGSEPLG